MTHSVEELLTIASKKLGIVAKKAYTQQGGEIDDIKLLRDDDVLYITSGEPFISVDLAKQNVAPSVLLRDPVRKPETFGHAFTQPSTSSSHAHQCSAQFLSELLQLCSRV